MIDVELLTFFLLSSLSVDVNLTSVNTNDVYNKRVGKLFTLYSLVGIFHISFTYQLVEMKWNPTNVQYINLNNLFMLKFKKIDDYRRQ